MQSIWQSVKSPVFKNLNLGYHNRHIYTDLYVWFYIFVMWRHARKSRKTQARRKVRARLAQVFPCTTSIAARGGRRKFQKVIKLYNSEEHLPIESFVTTLIHWTFFSDDANKVGVCWLCRSGQLHVTPSSRWSLPRCHRSVRNDMRLFLRTKQYPVQLRTTKFWKVLPQYYSVLQSTTQESTTPVLLRTTKYYFVLQSTSPVLQSTYSNTSLYYKVLVQYYSVLQSTTPSTTSYYKALLQY